MDVDEVIAQLLASEGFASVEEVAYVSVEEVAEIEGFDEETAQEIQSRAVDFIERQNAAFDEKRRELGVEDGVGEIAGITAAMLVALGENEIKTLEDFAGCVTDDLLGWNEQVDGERKHMKGILESFEIEAEDAQNMIMAARVKVGWVTEEELAAMNAPEEVEEEGEEELVEGEVADGEEE